MYVLFFTRRQFVFLRFWDLIYENIKVVYEHIFLQRKKFSNLFVFLVSNVT